MVTKAAALADLWTTDTAAAHTVAHPAADTGLVDTAAEALEDLADRPEEDRGDLVGMDRLAAALEEAEAEGEEEEA